MESGSVGMSERAARVRTDGARTRNGRAFRVTKATRVGIVVRM